MENIYAFVPCRKGSKRIINKNTKKFANSSLLEIKLNQLINIKEISKIIISTDDEKVIEIAKKMNNDKFIIEKREDYYASDECSNEEFIKYFCKKFNFKGHLLWTHVTSPFIDEKVYTRAIKEYLKNLNKYDSLVSANVLKEYLWNSESKAINYDDIDGKRPKSQNLEEIYAINSAIFLIDFSLMRKYNSRFWKTPYIFKNTKIEWREIDWQEDFDIGEILRNFFN